MPPSWFFCKPCDGVFPLLGLWIRPFVVPFNVDAFAAGEVASVSVVVVVGEPPLPNVVTVAASKFFSKHLLSPEEENDREHEIC